MARATKGTSAAVDFLLRRYGERFEGYLSLWTRQTKETRYFSNSEWVDPCWRDAELVEGRSRIRQFQRSRLRAARQIRDAFLHKGLKRLPRSVSIRDPLAQEVGDELASLIRAAEKLDGVVLRPAPVHRLGLENDRDADLSAYASRLADMHTLLAMLVEESAVDGATEVAAEHYFALQDKKWPSSAKIDRTHPLLIDGLALTYLQTTGLLDAVLRTFTEVYVDESAEDEATSLLDYDRQIQEVSAVVDRIRRAVRDAYVAGKIIFTPRRSAEDSESDASASATLNLLSNLAGSAAVFFDDRMLNGEAFAVDRSGHRARTSNSLELMDELAARGTITADERRQLRLRLRRGGATLVPVDSAEIHYAVLRNQKRESPEFRVIRDNIDLTRLAEIPRFPAEIPWFASLYTATKEAVLQLWQTHPDRAADLADAVLTLRPKPQDWVARWEGQAPPNWSDAMERMLAFGLSLPIDITDKEILTQYNVWLEGRVLETLRRLKPSRIDGVAAHIRDLISRLAKDLPDEP